MALSMYVDGDEDIPVPSAPGRDQELITVPPHTAAQLALYTAMRHEGKSVRNLARSLGIRESRARRLLDFNRPSRLDQILFALRILAGLLSSAITRSPKPPPRVPPPAEGQDPAQSISWSNLHMRLRGSPSCSVEATVGSFSTRGSLGLSGIAVVLIAVAGLAVAQQPRLPETGSPASAVSGALEANGACEPDAETLCLHGGRYELQADWRTGDGNSGAAQVVPKGTRDSGLFRFFDAENWEILIKVLDGCAVNGHHWVYGASTTDLGYEIRVKDTATDDAKVYRNEPGRPAPAITDGKAFPRACEAGASPLITSPIGGFRAPGEELAPVSLRGESESGCVTDDTSLCLADSRFKVTVDWSTTGGGEGSASTVPGGTNNSGLFYFFEPNNWEMLIKVLDGCAINGHYWVYSAAATDLGLDIRVTDTATGATWTYEKRPGPPAPAVTESEAFPGSCGPLPPVLASPGAIGVEWNVWHGDVDYDAAAFFPFAADFDDDGDDDVLLAATSHHDVATPRSGVILINKGNFGFEVAAGDPPRGVDQREVLMADFNGDGTNDFFMADHGYDRDPWPGWQNQLLLGSRDGYVDATHRLPDDPTGFTHNAAVGDIDGDGDTDILVANHGGDWIPGPYFLMNDGKANFVADRSRMPDSLEADNGWVRWPWAVQLADLDGDGHLDLLIGSSGLRDGQVVGSESFVFWGSAAGEYRDDDRTVLPAPRFVAADDAMTVISTQVNDLNGDGRADILLGSYDSTFSGRSAQLFVNSGGRTFVDETTNRLGRSAWSTTEGSPVEHRLFDFNGDGTVDIVPQRFDVVDGPNVLAWLNDGTGRYAVLKSTDFEQTEAVQHALTGLGYGVIVRGEGGFKHLEFHGDGRRLQADAGVVVEGAVIRPRF